MDAEGDKSTGTARKLLDQAAHGTDISDAYNQLPDQEKMNIFKAMNAMQKGEIPGFPSSNLLVEGVDTDQDGDPDQLKSIIDVSNSKQLFKDRPASNYSVKDGDNLYKIAGQALGSCSVENPTPAKIMAASQVIADENGMTDADMDKLKPGDNLYLNGNLVSPGRYAEEPQTVENLPLEIKSAGASPNRVERIKEVLGSIPEKITSFLHDSGVSVLASLELCSESPSLAMETPRGYENGSLASESPAIFDPETDTVIVRQKFSDGKDEVIASPDDYADSIRHEVGHALDKSLGDISHSAVFADAYQADVADMTAAQKEDLSYYVYDTNDSDAYIGQEEAFAQVFSAVYKDETLVRDPKDPIHEEHQKILKAFPRLAEAMRSQFKVLFPEHDKSQA